LLVISTDPPSAYPHEYRIGNTGMPSSKLVENVLAVAEHAGNKLPRSWANIRSIAIKTPESTSLPIYHKLSQEMLEIVEKAGVAPPKKQEDVSKPKVEPKTPANTPTTKSPLVQALKKSQTDSSAKKEKKSKDSSAKKEKKKRRSTSTQ
jgi:Ribosomal protein L1p/L10e family